MHKNTMYTVGKCKSKTDDTIVGAIHGSNYAYSTLCGKEIVAEKWYIITNSFDGEITCKKCLKYLEA